MLRRPGLALRSLLRLGGLTMASVVFERISAGAVLLNTTVLVWGLLDATHHELAERIETAILVGFLVELIVRLHRTGWNLVRFIRQPWAAFDALVILLALAPLPLNASLLRAARLGRLVHLGRHISGLSGLLLLRLVRNTNH
jgi:hypothetical protein